MIGIDCGGRKIDIVNTDLNFAHHIEVKRSERGNELQLMAHELDELATRGWLEGPVWVEAPVVAGARNIQSTIAVAQTTGVVHAVLHNTHQIAVSSWKQLTAGKGNADKSQVRAWLDANHPDVAHLCGGNQDLYDAACIALAGSAIAATVAASGLSPLRGRTSTDRGDASVHEHDDALSGLAQEG